MFRGDRFSLFLILFSTHFSLKVRLLFATADGRTGEKLFIASFAPENLRRDEGREYFFFLPFYWALPFVLLLLLRQLLRRLFFRWKGEEDGDVKLVCKRVWEEEKESCYSRSTFRCFFFFGCKHWSSFLQKIPLLFMIPFQFVLFISLLPFSFLDQKFTYCCYVSYWLMCALRTSYVLLFSSLNWIFEFASRISFSSFPCCVPMHIHLP